jgi:hypothetical protein
MRSQAGWVLTAWLVAGCVDATTEDLAGQLVRVEVSAAADDCRPVRSLGDGGVQFLGARADGTVLLSLAQTVQYGPLPDGGGLDGAALLQVPNPAASATLGLESGCDATVGLLSLNDAGVLLEQHLPGWAECPSGPLWLPATRCSSTRQLRFTPLGPCHLRCVHLSASSDVTCDC